MIKPNLMTFCLQQINVTDTIAYIEGLEMNMTYHMFVVTVNDHGTSLPSSMLLLNMTEASKYDLFFNKT